MRLFRKKGKKEITVKKREERDEWDIFEAKVYEQIPEDARELVKHFLIRPSSIKDIDPNEELEKAKELEKKGRYADALYHYRPAALAAFYQKSRNVKKFWDAYKNFLGKHENLAQWHSGDIKAYKELIQKKDIKKKLIDTYDMMTGVTAEVKKKES